MQKLLTSILILISTLLLQACGPQYKTTYSYVQPKSTEARMCTMQCNQSKQLCDRLCRADYESCQRSARDDARYRYDDYASRCQVEGKPIDRDLNSFYNSHGCRQQCECMEDYNGCFTSCGGDVIATTQCVAFCDK